MTAQGFWEEFPSIEINLKRIKALLLDELNKGHPEIRQSLLEMAGANGKMLRAGFFLLCAGFGKMEQAKLERLGAAIELLHMATLIHDDVIDDSPSRRGQPALHVRHGKRNAILMGDYLFALCFTLVADYAQPENVKLLSRTLNAMCTSELHQSAQLYRPSTSVRQYLRRITGKTAALFSFSCFLGGFESKCPVSLANHLAKLGYAVGTAFQITDDILDFLGHTQQLGKPIHKDLAEGIFTLPLIYALQKSNGALTTLLDRYPYEEETVRQITEIVTRHGIPAARFKAEQYTSRALKTVNRLPAGENRILLGRAVEKLLHRDW